MTNQPPRNFIARKKFSGKSWPPWPQNDHTKLLLVERSPENGELNEMERPLRYGTETRPKHKPRKAVAIFWGEGVCIYIYI